MFREEQRRVAIGTFIRYDHSYADIVAELGYPSRATLRLWWKGVRVNRGDAEGKGHAPVEARRRTDGQRSRLLPRAWQEPLQDDEGPWLPKEQADAWRVD